MRLQNETKSLPLFLLTLLAVVGYGLVLPWGTCGPAAWPAWTALWSGQELVEAIFHALFDNRFVCIGLFLFICILVSHLNLFHLKTDTYLPCTMLLMGFSMLPHLCISGSFMAALMLFLLAVDKWFGALHEGGQPTTAYAIGLLMGLSGLLYMPAVCCIIIFWGGFFRAGLSAARSIAASAVGLLTPFLCMQVALFALMDVPWTFVRDLVTPLWTVPEGAWDTPLWPSVVQGAVLFVLAFGAMVSLWSRKMNVSTSIWHAWLFLVWMLLFSIASALLIPSQPAGLYLFGIPFLALLSGNFLAFAFRRRKQAVWILVPLVLLSLLTQEEHYLASLGRQTLFDMLRHLFQTTTFDFLSCL